MNAFVINMPNSKERYRLFQEECKRENIEVERLNGVDGLPYLQKGDKPLTRGIIGCIMASCNAIRLAKERGYESVLIFDDDAELCDNFKQELEKVMSELPANWDFLRLHKTTSGTPKIESYSDNLNQVYGGNGTYGYVVNSRFYDDLLRWQNDEFRKPSKQDIGFIKTYDVILQEMMNTYSFFEVKTPLVFHRDGYSDRMGMDIKYGLNKPVKENNPIQFNAQWGLINFKEQRLNIKIYYPLHVQLHAEKLAETFCSLGYNAQATREVNDDDCLYILYCAFQIKHLPKKYIVYQCEQWNSGWFDKWYWDIMEGALQIWEFAECNLEKYSANLLHKVTYVPAGLVNGRIETKNIDVLFYGAISKHRLDVINNVRRSGIHIMYKSDVYGEQMKAILGRTKVVLNLHFYEDGYLEAFRINEALSCGCHVVSERNQTAFYPEKYRDLVLFGTNTSELVFAIRKALNTAAKYDLSVLDNTNYIKEAILKL